MGKCYSVLAASPKNVKRKEVNGWNSKKTAGDFTSFVAKFNSSGSGEGGAAGADGLLQIPGRLFGNGSSSIASLHTQQGKKGTNQDAMIVWENFCSRGDEVFCGVFDGHGPYGHMVAKTVRDSLPILLCSQWVAKSQSDQDVSRSKYAEEGMDGDRFDSQEVEETEKLPELYLPLKKAMLKAFRMMDKELKLRSAIDCFCSGSTAVTMVKKGQDLILGNIGDSRAILATRDKNNALTAVQLTTDLKPNLPREAARIQQCKGRVFALQDEPEVARVWLPNSDSPGLAMARAFGDFCLKDFGLISVPVVYYRRLTERDEFVVLATDGVWDVLSNKEAVDIIASAPSRATAARALVDCATRAWRLKYPTSKTDDCAVVCLFLEQLQAPNAAPAENGLMNGDIKRRSSDFSDISVSDDSVVEDSGTYKENGEIVPALESPEDRARERGQSKRSLAECLTTGEEEEWSALEGITRVNSLLSIPRFSSDERSSTTHGFSSSGRSSTTPRFSSGERSSANWRKWL